MTSRRVRARSDRHCLSPPARASAEWMLRMVSAIDQRVGEQDCEPELPLEIVIALAPFDPAAEEVDGGSQVADSSVGSAERVGRRRSPSSGSSWNGAPAGRSPRVPPLVGRRPGPDRPPRAPRGPGRWLARSTSVNPASASSVLSSRSAIEASRSISSASGFRSFAAARKPLLADADRGRKSADHLEGRSPGRSDSILDM